MPLFYKTIKMPFSSIPNDFYVKFHLYWNSAYFYQKLKFKADVTANQNDELESNNPA